MAEKDDRYYSLRLYIAGTTPQSIKALNNIQKICQEYLAGRYELEVIDVYQQPNLVAPQNIVAIPTLIKELPLPLQRLIGNMSNIEKVLVGLDIKHKDYIP
nr:circadian clock KaiB family protein [Gloeothece verrucosa]